MLLLKIIVALMILCGFCDCFEPREFKIICWIPTDPVNHDRSLHVMNTWGRRCDRLLFFSTGHDDVLNPIVVNAVPNWKHLWGKVRRSVSILYERFLEEGDWFLKADDDTYVIIENLRHMLKDYNSSEALYFGSRFKSDDGKGFMYGGAGYVLSREALRRLVEIAFNDANSCQPEGSIVYEDMAIGECLQVAEVLFGNSRDELERDRFLPLRIDSHTQPFVAEEEGHFWQDMFYITFPGIVNCSEKPISYHKVTSKFMYVFEYLLYHAQVYS